MSSNNLALKDDATYKEYEKMFDKIYSDPRIGIQKYVYRNGVLSSATAFSVGAITKEFLTSLMEELLFPLFILMGKLLSLDKVRDMLMSRSWGIVGHDIMLRLGKVSWILVVWLSTILLTYLVLEYFLNRYLIGLSSQISEEQRFSFVKSKIEAMGLKFDENKLKKYWQENSV